MAVRSGHGVGKSTLLAWLALWWLVTRFPAKVGTTAPTEHQLQDILWAEIGAWFKRLDPEFQRWFKLTTLRLEMIGDEDESFAAGRVSRPESPEAFAGYHSENMLLIGDEASGIAEPVYEVGIGAMSTPNARMVLASNPTKRAGMFFDCFHKLRGRWWTLRVNSEEVPRATGHIDDVIAKYGKHSNVYRVRVLGEFPDAGDDGVISLDICESAKIRNVLPINAKPRWGVDVARFGDDRSTLCKRIGNVIPEPVKFWHGKDTMQVAGLIKLEWDGTPKEARPELIAVDVIGIGAGVVDRLKEHNLPVVGVNVAESPTIKDDQYLRQRDELWFMAKHWLQALDSKLPDDEELIGELTGPKYAITSNGKIKVESKEEMKKRGLLSPDKADALCLTFVDAIPPSVSSGNDDYNPGGWMG